MNGTYETRSAEETCDLGRRLAAAAGPGTVIALVGDLGCGKTCLTQAFAREAGVTVPVTSPTFTLMNRYDGSFWPVYHFDLYRLDDKADYTDLDFDEYLYGNGVCLIEWAEKCASELPDTHIRVTFRITGPESRHITVTGAPA